MNLDKKIKMDPQEFWWFVMGSKGWGWSVGNGTQLCKGKYSKLCDTGA